MFEFDHHSWFELLKVTTSKDSSIDKLAMSDAVTGFMSVTIGRAVWEHTVFINTRHVQISILIIFYSKQKKLLSLHNKINDHDDDREIDNKSSINNLQLQIEGQKWSG